MSLPLVNMCLRAQMEMIINDLDLWADFSSLDFDEQLAKEMTKSRENGHRRKTTYDLMVAVFSTNDDKEDGISKTSVAETGVIPEDPFCAAYTTPTKKKGGTAPLSKKSGLTRMSKLQTAGQEMRQKLLQLNSL